MNLRTILPFFFTLICYAGFSQASVSVSYKENNDLDLVMIADLAGIQSINVELKGDFKGKRAYITEYTVKGDSVSAQLIVIYKRMLDSTILIKGKFMKLSDEKIKAYIAMEGMLHSRSYGLPVVDLFHSAVRTPLDVELNNDIPIFAYSSGIKVMREYNGQSGEGFDFCKLSDAKVHPSQWYKEFGIPNYIYYTIHFDYKDEE